MCTLYGQRLTLEHPRDFTVLSCLSSHHRTNTVDKSRRLSSEHAWRFTIDMIETVSSYLKNNIQPSLLLCKFHRWTRFRGAWLGSRCPYRLHSRLNICYIRKGNVSNHLGVHRFLYRVRRVPVCIGILHSPERVWRRHLWYYEETTRIHVIEKLMHGQYIHCLTAGTLVLITKFRTQS